MRALTLVSVSLVLSISPALAQYDFGGGLGGGNTFGNYGSGLNSGNVFGNAGTGLNSGNVYGNAGSGLGGYGGFGHHNYSAPIQTYSPSYAPAYSNYSTPSYSSTYSPRHTSSYSFDGLGGSTETPSYQTHHRGYQAAPDYSSTYSSPLSTGDHYVRGYTRSNGTYVAPHYQSNPNSSVYDNYSEYGNVNPHNGKMGHKHHWGF
jgi:hypothetical protein